MSNAVVNLRLANSDAVPRQNPSQLPLDDGTGPSQATSEDYHEELVSPHESPGAVCLIESDCNGSGQGIAITIKIDHEAVHGDIETAGNCLNDTKIGLVRDEASDFRSDELASRFDTEKESGAGYRNVEADGFERADLGQHLPIYFSAGGDCLKQRHNWLHFPPGACS